MRLIDRYIRVGDSVATYWTGAGGNNGNDGLTRSTRWLDLTNVNAGGRSAGDVFNIIGPSTYAGAGWVLDPAVSGTSGSKMLLRAEPGQEIPQVYTTPLTMKGNGKAAPIVIDGEDTLPIIKLNVRDHWRIESVGLKQAVGIGVLSDGGRTGNEFYNLLVNDCLGSAFDIDESTDLRVENCHGQDNEGDFIKAQGASPWCKRLTVRLNYSNRNWDDFITLSTSDTGSDFSIIEMNRADYQFDRPVGDPFHSDGVEVANATRLIIRNNIISDFTIPVYLSGFSGQEQTLQDIWIYGNIFWNDRRFSEAGKGMAPLFVDSRNNRNDTIERVHAFWNSYGFAGATDNAIAFTGDGSETTIADIVLRNELFFDCRDDVTKQALDIGSDYTSGVDTDYHCYHRVSDTPEANSINTDPLLVSYTGKTSTPNFDFRLRDGSPCIGAGDPALTTSIPGFGTAIPTGYTDMAGTVRRLNGGDIGALEYVGSKLALVLVG